MLPHLVVVIFDCQCLVPHKAHRTELNDVMNLSDTPTMITENLGLWASAIQQRSATGRGSSKKIDLYGIKKLRELILELAVRGKLVPQNPEDEPAFVLLGQIAAEKAQLIKDKKIKRQKALPEVSSEEVSKTLPEGWVWTRLGNISEIGPRNNNISDKLEVSFVPMPLVSTSFNGAHGSETRSWEEIKKGYTHFADGDIAVAKITPCFENSKAAVFSGLKNGVGSGTTELHVARPVGDTINPFYILLYLKAPQFLKVGETKMPCLLPPVDEQQRIVERVAQLKAICDQIKTHLQQAQQTRLHLADAMVEQSLS